ncbi:MAG: hypothetical protein QW764_01800 [Desulfurococcaceae archaeon]
MFCAQRCVEKCVKALLEVKKRVVYNRGPELVEIPAEDFRMKRWWSPT